MPVALEEFVQQLEDSGILAGDTIKDFIPPKASPRDAEELARELVRKKKLTKFQAEEVSKGKGKSLVLGNYVLMEKIGAGGMGQVFKAEHRRMHRTVAIKMLPPNVTKDAAAIARFEREVTAAAKLRHPNIVAADDADCANGVHFLVMEMVDGRDLSALVKQNGPFSIEKAVNYVLQAAKGLEFAHRKGVVHRDIKPANLLLDTEGVVKILDMGLARLSLDGDEAPQADLTSTGTIMGTVDYMAPEQALDTKAADARADIYALGCSLFFLLTGKSTYEGDTLMKKLLAHREQPIPSLRAVRAEVSEQLEAVFRKMVAKKIEDRFQTMTDVISALERCGSIQAMTQTFQLPIDTAAAGTSTLPSSQMAFAEATILSAPSVKTATAKTGNTRKLGLLVAAAVGVAMLAVIIVSLRTKDGTLVVEIDQPDAMVQVLDAEGKVEVSQRGGNGPVSISVDPGKHRLRVEKEGFTVFGQDFEMKSAGKTPIKAKLVPLDEKPVLVETKSASIAPVALPVTAGEKKLLFFDTPAFTPWAKDVANMSAEKQVEAVSKKLVELNPSFDGKLEFVDGSRRPVIVNGVVTELAFHSDHVTDISPVRALLGLKQLLCSDSNFGHGDEPKGALQDLSPLRLMQLNVLFINGTQVSDLSPLREMPLRNLQCCQTLVSDISPLKGMPLTALACFRTKVSDLSPLKGMPLTYLEIQYTPASDLSPLKGMPLTLLYLHGTPITDLSLLRESPLRTLFLDFKPERDTELLRSIKTLGTINGQPAAEFWKEVEEQQRGKKLGFQMPGFDQWVKDVAAMPAAMQVEAVSRKLVELNPDFDGKVTEKIEDGTVTSLGFVADDVTDLSPVRALERLKSLSCCGATKGASKLFDLSPLEGMKLTSLYCHTTQISDFSPIKNTSITYLHCGGTPIADLSSLRGMRLTTLICSGTNVSDLSALEGMPLTRLSCIGTLVSELAPLETCKSLKSLEVSRTKVTPAAVDSLQKALPNCKIEWDDPTKAATSPPR